MIGLDATHEECSAERLFMNTTGTVSVSHGIFLKVNCNRTLSG
jgi:hypothetical protein